MSLQRVFHSARKLGFPVIVTDGEGQEPSVILPLDQFEALIGEESRTNHEVVSETPSTSNVDFSEENSKIALEERFYLEPIEDGSLAE